jgi:hypothetical protein
MKSTDFSEVRLKFASGSREVVGESDNVGKTMQLTGDA